MNMMSSSAEAGIAYFQPENLDSDVRRLIGLTNDFDRIGPLPALESITCTFRALIDWNGDDDPEQAFRLSFLLHQTKEAVMAEHKTKDTANIKIKIDATNENDAGELQFMTAGCITAIEDALANVNGSATSFTITKAAAVQRIVKRAEKHLFDNHVIASETSGTKVFFRPAGPSANAYKYAAISTMIELTRTGSGWYLTAAERVEVHSRQAEKFLVCVSDKAAYNAALRTLKAFGRTSMPNDPLLASAA
jgi:hypothetical protein